MTQFDFCLAWNWEYDADFAEILSRASLRQGLSFLQATPGNLGRLLEALAKEEMKFRAFLDRASESDPAFLPLVEWAKARPVCRLNPQELALKAMNKASMHLEFITAGIHTPYTIILPPFSERAALPSLNLSPLGARFIIKPAHGGGGEGVVEEAASSEQVQGARQGFPQDYYLLQARIVPTNLAGKPGWFRVIFCGGKVYPCWWDPASHIYQAVKAEEEETFGLGPLTTTTQLIFRICGLDMFSTEIALTSSGHFVSVDYVNDQIDLRLQSKACDGVPDQIVLEIADTLVEMVRRKLGST
ncbi:MAG: hypothetical protein AB1715_05535 [Acidobacteriota bacterium]